MSDDDSFKLYLNMQLNKLNLESEETENDLTFSKSSLAKNIIESNNEEKKLEPHKLSFNKETESWSIETGLTQSENNQIIELQTSKELENSDMSNDSSSDNFKKCRENDSISSDEEIVVKHLDKEISNSPKSTIDALCNSEKHNFNFHILNKTSNLQSFDGCSNVEFEMHEYLKTEDNICNVNSCAYELNDIRLCVDTILDNVGLTGEKSELINNFIVTEKEESQASSQKLCTSSGTLQRDHTKRNDNHVIIPVNLSISPDKKTEKFTERLDTKISSTSEKYLSIEDVSIDQRRANQRDEVMESAEQKIENVKGNNCLFNEIAGSYEESDDTEPCHNINFEYPDSIHKDAEQINHELTINNTETTATVNENLSNLEGELQSDHKCDTFAEYPAITSEHKEVIFTKFFDIEISDLRQQDIHAHYISEDDSCNSVDINTKDILLDYEKTDERDMSDNAEYETRKIENIQAKISYANTSITDVNREFCDLNNVIQTKETELTNNYFNLNDRKKTTVVNQEIKNRSLQKEDYEISTKPSDTESDGSDKQNIQACYESNDVDSIADKNLESISMKDQRSKDIFIKEYETANQMIVDINLENIALGDYERLDQVIDDLTEKDVELINNNFIVNKQKSEEISEGSSPSESAENNQTKLGNGYVKFDLIDANGSEENCKDFIKTPCEKNGTSICNESVGVNRKMSKIDNEEGSCPRTVLEGPSFTESGSGHTNDIAIHNRKVSETSSCESSMHDSNKNNQLIRLNKELLQLTKRKSKLKVISADDSDVVIVSDNDEKNNDYKTLLAKKLSDISDKTENCTGAQSYAEFNKELDYELKNLKAQYSTIESKLLKGTKSFSEENVSSFISKVKEELHSCMQSLEELGLKLRSKLVQSEPKILDEDQSFRSFHRQQFYEEKNTDRYRLQDWQGMLKTSHKFRERSQHFSNSDKETCKSVHRKKFKLSQFSYEHNFQPCPKEKIKNSAKRSCLAKNSIYSQEVVGSKSKKEPKFLSYSSDCHAKVGSFSKSFIEHKELKFSQSSPKNYTNHISHSLSKPCCRKKISESRYVKKFKLHKCEKERYLSTDSSDSSNISSFSDEEFQPIRKDPKYFHGYSKYLKTITSISELVKKAANPSKKERSKKRVRESSYESDLISIDSSGDDSVDEIRPSFRKRGYKEKSFKRNAQRKRVDSLIDRQLDFINKCASKKGELVEFVPASFTASNTVQKCQENYSDEEYSSDEINKSKAMMPILKYGKKRRKEASEKDRFSTPSKLSKFRSHNSVHHLSKVKHGTKSSGKKLKSNVVSLSSYLTPISLMKTKRLSPFKLAETRNRAAELPTLKNKHSSEDIKTKLRSSVVSLSADISSLLEETERRKNEMKSGYISTLPLDDQVNGQDQMKFRKFDNKCSELMFRDVAQDNKNKGYSEIETNDEKDTQSHTSFLKKKREPEFTAGRVHKVQNTLKQRRIDFVHPENNLDKLRKKVSLQSKNKSLKDSSEELPVASGRLDSFKKLNEEMRKTSVMKRKQMKSKIKNSNVGS